ncbi:LuxR C-terminal-related transcriptional regulator [Chloroflexi bacterium TSY]|nr:LuxR C-terminal-related transcriptional regulator [Chloroflexi bacterium TSY]
MLLTRIVVNHGTDAEVQAIIVQLQEALRRVQARHWVQREIQVLAHLTLAHDRLDQAEKAGLNLRQALGLALPGGAMRSFIDCGPALIPLLEQRQQKDVAPDYVAQLVAGIPSAPQPKSTSNATSNATPNADEEPLLDRLTQREEEVLTLMQAGLTNQEIADKLIISLYTVKRHATNIYNKLAVNNRRQAIRKARQLGSH